MNVSIGITDNNLIEIWDEWIITRYMKRSGPGSIFYGDSQLKRY
jgi:hypothetical protein